QHWREPGSAPQELAGGARAPAATERAGAGRAVGVEKAALRAQDAQLSAGFGTAAGPQEPVRRGQARQLAADLAALARAPPAIRLAAPLVLEIGAHGQAPVLFGERALEARKRRDPSLDGAERRPEAGAPGQAGKAALARQAHAARAAGRVAVVS